MAMKQQALIAVHSEELAGFVGWVQHYLGPNRFGSQFPYVINHFGAMIGKTGLNSSVVEKLKSFFSGKSYEKLETGELSMVRVFSGSSAFWLPGRRYSSKLNRSIGESLAKAILVTLADAFLESRLSNTNSSTQ